MSLVNMMSKEVHEALGAIQRPVDSATMERVRYLHSKFGVEAPDETYTYKGLALPEAMPSLQEMNSRLMARWDKVDARIAALLVRSDAHCPTRTPVGWSKATAKGFVAIDRPGDGLSGILDFETIKVAANDWRPVCGVYVTTEGLFIYRANPKLPKEALARTVSIGRKNLYVGHSVGYDLGFITEEMSHQPSGSIAYCTLGSHILVSGVSNQQQGLLKLKDEEDFACPPWLEYAAPADLAAVYQHYTGKDLSKDVRDLIVFGGWNWVRSNQELVLKYCFQDCVATQEVLSHLYPLWLDAMPDAGCRLGTLYQHNMLVPLAPEFDDYYRRAEDAYQKINGEIATILLKAADKVKDTILAKCQVGQLGEQEEASEDSPSWTQNKKRYQMVPVVEMTVAEKHQLEQLEWKPIKSKVWGEVPTWYASFADEPTIGKRCVPIILGITWCESLIQYDRIKGWRYRDTDGSLAQLPSPEKQGMPVHSPFIKGYTTLGSEPGEQEVVPQLGSATPGGMALLTSLMATMYWRSFRARVEALPATKVHGGDYKVVKPQASRTISNRVADKVWMVMSHPKAHRIGSHLRWLIQPPPGYCFVKADIDSQELDLFASVGDSSHGHYGYTPLGKSLRTGSKEKGTDPHSLLGALVGIENRTLMKNLNYGATYGLGKKGATDYVQKANPKWLRAEAQTLAVRILVKQQGERSELSGRFQGGMGSASFNAVAEICGQRRPRTPYGNMALSIPLSKAGVRAYSTTFRNWAIQASGSCMTTKLLAVITELCYQWQVPGKLVLTVHDEICFMAREEYGEQLAAIFQLAHILVRADITDCLGLDGIPCNGAWFSSVEIDYVFRKEIGQKAKTPDMPDMCIRDGKAYRDVDVEVLLRTLGKS